MTGFMNQDGSALVGGLTPAGSGQALQLDTQGNVAVQAWQFALQLQGKAYTATTGLINVAAGNYPLCIFNPANSGKNVALYSLHVSSGTAGANSISVFLQMLTSNPAYASTAAVTAARSGSPASSLAGTCTFASTTQTLSPPYAQVEISINPVELLINGGALLLPSGVASGVSVFLQTYASGFSSLSAKWLEF